jgi:hypothetical protein
MNDSNAQDYPTRVPKGATDADTSAPEGVLAFIANMLAAFTHVDPRVITRQERHSGKTALSF